MKNFQDAVDRVCNLSITGHAIICLSSSAKELFDSLRVNVEERFNFF